MEARIRELEKAVPREVINVNAAAENTMVVFSAIEELRKDTLGARTPIISGHMLNTLRIQSISDHNMSSGQKLDTFKMYPVM